VRITGSDTQLTYEAYILVQLNIHRIRITSSDKKVVIDNDARKTIREYHLKNHESLLWKDLGPQVCEPHPSLCED